MFLEHSRMRIKESYEKVRQDLGAILDPVELVIRTLPEEEAFAMRYLYAFMPYSDIANNPVETYLDLYGMACVCMRKRGGTGAPRIRLPAICVISSGQRGRDPPVQITLLSSDSGTDPGEITS